MRNAVLKIVAYFATFVIIFVLQKPVFLTVYASEIGASPLGSLWPVVAHGLAMDCSMAGYLTVVPGLLAIAALWIRPREVRIVGNVYSAIAATAISIVFCLDIVLYGYWGFRLDMTPLFYFTTSPTAAMASAGAWMTVAGIAGCAALAAVLYLVLTRLPGRIAVAPTRSVPATVAATLLTAALFIPIRGGVTVSTMNLSRAYFSQNQRLNHAAINPMFSLMYSATHQSDFASQYRFMEPSEAAEIFATLTDRPCERPDTALSMTKTTRPDIVIVILESFSSHLMPSLGGDSVAMGLDSIARNGLLFSRFYANSFRTDRALTSILSAYPGQPSTSVMKHVEKMESLPSLPRTLKENGWEPSYFYGGDANFTNMLAYLVRSGFEKITSDKDFPLAERTSKWGAHDHLLFDKAAADILAPRPGDSRPRLDVIQTSSSHEPFEVPYDNPRFSAIDPRVNAFAYTDSCLTAFVNRIAASPSWGNTLVIITPDHYGAWPRNLDNPLDRHAVPLVVTGGALALPGRIIDTPGCQTDIAATLLGSLGIPHDDFLFSKDLLNPASPHYGVFTERDLIGLISDTDTAVVNLDTGDTMPPHSSPKAAAEAKAFLQTLYDNLSNL